MSDTVIFVKVVEMGQGNGTPQEKAYEGAKTIKAILQDLGIELSDRKIKLNGSEASVDDLVTQDNATIAILPRKIKGGQ